MITKSTWHQRTSLASLKYILPATLKHYVWRVIPVVRICCARLDVRALEASNDSIYRIGGIGESPTMDECTTKRKCKGLPGGYHIFLVAAWVCWHKEVIRTNLVHVQAHVSLGLAGAHTTLKWWSGWIGSSRHGKDLWQQEQDKGRNNTRISHGPYWDRTGWLD